METPQTEALQAKGTQMETLRVMLVMDGGSFNSPDQGFSLSTFISKLTAPKSWYEVIVEKRFLGAPQVLEDAGIVTFKASELLNANGERSVDQVWFFGLQQIGPHGRSLNAAELASITRFMNSGGGVFATGDHQSMGYKLCGEIPRVRSMRRWWYLHEDKTADSVDSHTDLYDEFGVPAPHVPVGIRPAPSASGPLRHDTLVLGTNAPSAVFSFNFQSDSSPQTIRPNYFYSSMSHHLIRSAVHPLLCGQTGPIRHLADHPHEGDCAVPTKLDDPLLFGEVPSDLSGQVEYPAGISGTKPVPVAVAYATVHGGHMTDSKDMIANTYEFTVNAAYDGFSANVGRVVVDSTWHHFFNVNFPYPEVDFSKPEWAEVAQYWNNIALWLLPNDRRAAFVASLATAILQAEGDVTLQTPFGGPLQNPIGPCMTLDFLREYIWIAFPRFPPFPWLQDPLIDPDPPLDFLSLASQVLRATVNQLRERTPVGGLGKIDAETFGVSVQHAVSLVKRQTAHEIRAHIKSLERAQDALAS
jgi:hypothetical protein